MRSCHNNPSFGRLDLNYLVLASCVILKRGRERRRRSSVTDYWFDFSCRRKLLSDVKENTSHRKAKSVFPLIALAVFSSEITMFLSSSLTVSLQSISWTFWRSRLSYGVEYSSHNSRGIVDKAIITYPTVLLWQVFHSCLALGVPVSLRVLQCWSRLSSAYQTPSQMIDDERYRLLLRPLFMGPLG